MPPLRPPAPLQRLLRYARAYRRRVALASVCSVLNKVFDLAPPALIGAAVDVVVQRESSLIAGLGIVDLRTQLVVLTIATVVIFLFESAFEYAYALLWRDLAQAVQHDLRVDGYAHVQELDLAYFEGQATGNLTAILNDDVNQLERFLDGGANDLIQVFTTVVIVGGVFFAVSPSLASLAFFPIPLILWGSFRFQRRIAPRYAEVREQVGALAALLANNLAGVVTIKSFVTERREVERVRAQSLAYLDSNRRAIRLSSAFSPAIRMAVELGFTATLLYGGLLALTGDISVGGYSVLVYLTQRLLWPLTRLGSTVDLYHRAMASTERVLDLLDTPITVAESPGAVDLASVRGEVALEAVDFVYPGTQVPVLRGLTLAVPAGTTAAIVGPTGAGKTSLIKLLLRFYDVAGGSVRVDGHDVRALGKASLRRAIGLVSQDVYLFHGTVRENIAYGADGPVDEATIVAAARAAEAHDFILALPQGYETVVGERGQRLSGGQRQRISIARAVLRDPRILILDEATSAVDNETEAAIQRSLARLAVGRTTIVIAHRLSTVRHAHCIHVLDAGQIVERGRHEELLAREGLYASLWRVQTGDAAPPA